MKRGCMKRGRTASRLVLLGIAGLCGTASGQQFVGNSFVQFSNPSPAATSPPLVVPVTGGSANTGDFSPIVTIENAGAVGGTSTFTNGAGSDGSLINANLDGNGDGTAELVHGNNPNVLTYSGSAFNAAAESPFAVGSISYFNGATFSNSTVTSVDATVNVVLTMPPGLGTQQFNFDFSFVFATNDPDQSAEENADELIISLESAPTTFEVDGKTFTLTLDGFAITSISGQDGQGLIGSQLQSLLLFENATVTADLLATFTENIPVIPLPHPVGMSSIALLGLLAARRRR